MNNRSDFKWQYVKNIKNKIYNAMLVLQYY